jgi:hypothetical protein
MRIDLSPYFDKAGLSPSALCPLDPVAVLAFFPSSGFHFARCFACLFRCRVRFAHTILSQTL